MQAVNFLGFFGCLTVVVGGGFRLCVLMSHAGDGHGVIDMLAEIYCFAVDVPDGAIVGGQGVVVPTLLQATGDALRALSVGFGCGLAGVRGLSLVLGVVLCPSSGYPKVKASAKRPAAIFKLIVPPLKCVLCACCESGSTV